MNLNTVLGQAIAAGAMRVTRKPIAALRRDIADLKRQLADLRRVLRAVKMQAGSSNEQAPAADDGVGNLPRIRPTGPMVRKLRRRLGLTQAEFAKLVGVSSLSVSKWEAASGRIRLRTRTLSALAGVRGIGKQAAKKMLAG